jgi:hypothetical protein
MIPGQQMIPGQPWDVENWAASTFGEAELGDPRRTKRLVAIGACLLSQPNAMLPQQMGEPAALKATYRLLANEAVSATAISQPYWAKSRQAAGAEQVTLLVQDTTEVNYTHHPQTQGLGPLGNGEGRGYLLQSVLAIEPETAMVIGVMHHEPFLRQPAPRPRESASQRKQRARESQVWERSVAAIGAPPAGATWVHVGDRGSDIFEFMQSCRQHACHFLLRICQNRRVVTATQEEGYLVAQLRALPAQATQRMELPPRRGEAARTAQVSLSFAPFTLCPPQRHPLPAKPLAVWGVRIWEAAPPADAKPLEWLLLSSLPVTSHTDGWRCRDWYRCRWLVEEYHKCLKTGCRLEQRHLQNKESLVRLLALLIPVAVRLLQLRDLARHHPQQLAQQMLPPDLVRVVAALAGVPPDTLTLDQLWRRVARLGGYQGRKGDGPPCWQTLWRGWQQLLTLLDGVRLATSLPPPTCG